MTKSVYSVRVQFLMAASVKMTVFRGFVRCSLLETDRRFRYTWFTSCLYRQGIAP
jgi:hypothetical protein